VKREGAVIYETLARGIKESNELEHLPQLHGIYRGGETTRKSDKGVRFWT
jgi:hypothetical protein